MGGWMDGCLDAWIPTLLLPQVAGCRLQAAGLKGAACWMDARLSFRYGMRVSTYCIGDTVEIFECIAVGVPRVHSRPVPLLLPLGPQYLRYLLSISICHFAPSPNNDKHTRFPTLKPAGANSLRLAPAFLAWSGSGLVTALTGCLGLRLKCALTASFLPFFNSLFPTEKRILTYLHNSLASSSPRTTHHARTHIPHQLTCHLTYFLALP